MTGPEAHKTTRKAVVTLARLHATVHGSLTQSVAVSCGVRPRWPFTCWKRTSASQDSLSELCYRWDDVTGLNCAVTYKGCVMRLSAGVADWHTVGWSQPADILCFACTDKEKKRLKTCQHLKIENALLKLQLLVNSVTERVLCSELTTLGKFVRSHTWCFL